MTSDSRREGFIGAGGPSSTARHNESTRASALPVQPSEFGHDRVEPAPSFFAALDRPAVPETLLIRLVRDGLRSVVPGFELESELASSGRTVVYRGRETAHPQRAAAVKVLWVAERSAATKRRLRRESQLLGSLQHPGIAQLIGSGETEAGDPFCATELVAGRPLHQYRLARTGTAHERVAVVRDIADALVHAHGRGVLHRDISPTNVIVRTAPTLSRICLIDFELARRGDDSDSSGEASPASSNQPPTTVEGSPFGTMGYMSPEQLCGHWSEVDARSDVFAVGVLLYELLTDRLPWDIRDRNCAEAIDIVRRSPAMPLQTVARETRGDLATIVNRAIERNPAARYQTMAAFRDDLDCWLAGQPILTTRPSIARVAGLAIRRHPWRSAAAACVLFAALAVMVVFDRKRQGEIAAIQRTSRAVIESSLLAQSVIGSAQVRERLLSAVAEQADRLLALAPYDPDSLRLRSAFLRAKSVLAHERRDTTLAESLREEALSIAESLAGRADATPDDLLDLATAHILRGDLAREACDYELATSNYEHAQRIHERLYDQGDRPLTVLRQLGCSYERRAAIARSTGKLPQASALVLEGIEWIGACVAANPQWNELRFERTVLLRLASEFASAAGDSEMQHAFLHRWRDDIEALIAETPANIDYRMSRADLEYALSRDAADSSRWEEAALHIRRNIADLDYLRIAEPGRVDLAESLRRSYTHLAEAEVGARRVEDGLIAMSMSVAIATDMLHRWPEEALAREGAYWTSVAQCNLLRQIEELRLRQ